MHIAPDASNVCTIVATLGHSCLLLVRKSVQQILSKSNNYKNIYTACKCTDFTNFKNCIWLPTVSMHIAPDVPYVYNCRHSWPFMLIVGAQQSVQLQFCRRLCLPLCAPQLSNEPVIYLKSSVNFNCHSTQQMAWPASFLVQK